MFNSSCSRTGLARTGNASSWVQPTCLFESVLYFYYWVLPRRSFNWHRRYNCCLSAVRGFGCSCDIFRGAPYRFNLAKRWEPCVKRRLVTDWSLSCSSACSPLIDSVSLVHSSSGSCVSSCRRMWSLSCLARRSGALSSRYLGCCSALSSQGWTFCSLSGWAESD